MKDVHRPIKLNPHRIPFTKDPGPSNKLSISMVACHRDTSPLFTNGVLGNDC